MSPQNLSRDHDRAVDMMIARTTRLSAEENTFLEGHLSSCPPCTERFQEIQNAVREMHNDIVYANPSMVRATQIRVRERAEQLRRQQETMRPLWISSALALGWAVVSMPLLWQGFAWLGHITHSPDVVWQTGFAVMALAPITAVGTIGLASRFHNKATS